MMNNLPMEGAAGGADHLGTAASLHALADLYLKQGKYTQAEPLYQQALAIREQRLGSDHPDTAIILNNLAVLYHKQSKYEEAELLYWRALVIREQQIGMDHPDTVFALTNLAEFYRKQGKDAEAELLYRQALTRFEQQAGADHPNVASSLTNLALFYSRQGKYTQAELLLRRSLAISEQQGGTQSARDTDEPPFLSRVIACAKQGARNLFRRFSHRSLTTPPQDRPWRSNRRQHPHHSYREEACCHHLSWLAGSSCFQYHYALGL